MLWKIGVPQNVAKHVDFYVNHAKHEKLVLGTDLEGDGVLTAVIFTKADETGLYKSRDVLKLDTASQPGMSMHDEAARKYRLMKLPIRRALHGATGGDWRKLDVLFTMTKEEIKASQEAFCQRFGCRLVQKQKDDDDNEKIYTNGDWFEFTVWCALGENPNNWRKNSRSYKTGTDCAEYEIKSAYWAGSTISPRINQFI